MKWSHLGGFYFGGWSMDLPGSLFSWKHHKDYPLLRPRPLQVLPSKLRSCSWALFVSLGIPGIAAWVDYEQIVTLSHWLILDTASQALAQMGWGGCCLLLLLLLYRRCECSFCQESSISKTSSLPLRLLQSLLAVDYHLYKSLSSSVLLHSLMQSQTSPPQCAFGLETRICLRDLFYYPIHFDSSLMNSTFSNRPPLLYPGINQELAQYSPHKAAKSHFWPDVTASYSWLCPESSFFWSC